MIENFILILIFVLITYISYAWITHRTESEKEYDKKLKESLKDEFIIDPETGKKLTLEEAESGNWSIEDYPDDEFRVMPLDELEKIPEEQSRVAQHAINYLKSSKSFRECELTEDDIETLDSTKILSGYDDWSYSHPFKFDKGILILPVGKLNTSNYSESYILIWLKISNINGHYLFKEKTAVERFFDRIRKDNDIIFDNYECATIKKSFNKVLVKNLAEKIISHQGLEIEIHNDNLFIQTLRLVNIEDIKKLEIIISKL
ncbi:hypothetical protein [Winogradskyella sp. SYSU M77433]|uniref:hypothetical protein n=1 Tax=Winogradskyella sp. SYSU M77433 TaxID=3042722 RepID=UPI0024811808|nr:hypothetical protein [Winogradskyella sp. SYSU M77433]MDH7913858.1 hypothetical protein [Winogradskyella sp. SYSU M77433]